MTNNHYYYNNRRRYGFSNLLLDLIMIVLTSGLWIIWIFIRELRNH